MWATAVARPAAADECRCSAQAGRLQEMRTAALSLPAESRRTRTTAPRYPFAPLAHRGLRHPGSSRPTPIRARRRFPPCRAVCRRYEVTVLGTDADNWRIRPSRAASLTQQRQAVGRIRRQTTALAPRHAGTGRGAHPRDRRGVPAMASPRPTGLRDSLRRLQGGFPAAATVFGDGRTADWVLGAMRPPHASPPAGPPVGFPLRWCSAGRLPAVPCGLAQGGMRPGDGRCAGWVVSAGRVAPRRRRPGRCPVACCQFVSVAQPSAPRAAPSPRRGRRPRRRERGVGGGRGDGRAYRHPGAEAGTATAGRARDRGPPGGGGTRRQSERGRARGRRPEPGRGHQPRPRAQQVRRPAPPSRLREPPPGTVVGRRW